MRNKQQVDHSYKVNELGSESPTGKVNRLQSGAIVQKRPLGSQEQSPERARKGAVSISDFQNPGDEEFARINTQAQVGRSNSLLRHMEEELKKESLNMSITSAEELRADGRGAAAGVGTAQRMPRFYGLQSSQKSKEGRTETSGNSRDSKLLDSNQA